MRIPTTSTGLLIGLGLRIIFDKLHSPNSPTHPTYRQLVFGILLFQILSTAPSQLGPAVCSGVAARIVLDLILHKDGQFSAKTLTGTGIGVVLAGLLSLLYNADLHDFSLDPDSSRQQSSHSKHKHRQKFDLPVSHHLPIIPEEASDLSSLAKEHTKLYRNSNLDALAIAAEGDARRCREERQWALEQGNYARANQLAWQIRKYDALRDSFLREARRAAAEVQRNKQSKRQLRHSYSTNFFTRDRAQQHAPRSNPSVARAHDISRPTSAPPEPKSSRSSDSPVAIDNHPEIPTAPAADGFQHFISRVHPMAEEMPSIEVRDEADERVLIEPKDEYRKYPTRERTTSMPTHIGPGPGYGLLHFITTTTTRTAHNPKPPVRATQLDMPAATSHPATSHPPSTSRHGPAVVALDDPSASPIIFVSTYTHDVV